MQTQNGITFEGLGWFRNPRPSRCQGGSLECPALFKGGRLQRWRSSMQHILVGYAEGTWFIGSTVRVVQGL